MFNQLCFRCSSLMVGVFLCLASQCYGYDLVIKTAEIASRKENGQGWDAAGAPDPYVQVYLPGGKSVTTSVEKNTYFPAWNESVGTVGNREIITFNLKDKDVLSDDAIGANRFTVPGAGVYEIRCQSSVLTISID